MLIIFIICCIYICEYIYFQTTTALVTTDAGVTSLSDRYTATLSRDDTSNGGYTGPDSTGANEPSSTTTATTAIIKTTAGDHGEGDGDDGRGGGDVSGDVAAVTDSGAGGDALETTTKAWSWRDAYANWLDLQKRSQTTQEPLTIVHVSYIYSRVLVGGGGGGSLCIIPKNW